MTIQLKKPPLKETVGAMYIAFATKDEDDETLFTATYEDDTTKMESVVTISVDENTSSTDVYGSGKVYVNVTERPKASIEVEALAIDKSCLVRMRGDTITDNGAILSPAHPVMPFFGFGKVVKFRDGSKRLDWYPKCQLSEFSEEDNTSEESFSTQNETITILAYPYDDDNNYKLSVDEQVTSLDWLTEDIFFATPILTDAQLIALKPSTETSGN